MTQVLTAHKECVVFDTQSGARKITTIVTLSPYAIFSQLLDLYSEDWIVSLILYYRSLIAEYDLQQNPEIQRQLKSYKNIQVGLADYLSALALEQTDVNKIKKLWQALDETSQKLVAPDVRRFCQAWPVLPLALLRRQSILLLIEKLKRDRLSQNWAPDEIQMLKRYFSETYFFCPGFNSEENYPVFDALASYSFLLEQSPILWPETPEQEISGNPEHREFLHDLLSIFMRTRNEEERHLRFKYILKHPHASLIFKANVSNYLMRQYTGFSLNDVFRVELNSMVSGLRARRVLIVEWDKKIRFLSNWLLNWFYYSENEWTAGLFAPSAVLGASVEDTMSNWHFRGHIAGETFRYQQGTFYLKPYLKQALAVFQAKWDIGGGQLGAWLESTYQIRANAVAYPFLGPSLLWYSIAKILVNQKERLSYYAQWIRHGYSPYKKVINQTWLFFKEHLNDWIVQGAPAREILLELTNYVRTLQSQSSFHIRDWNLGCSGLITVSASSYDALLEQEENFVTRWGHVLEHRRLFTLCYGDEILEEKNDEILYNVPDREIVKKN